MIIVFNRLNMSEMRQLLITNEEFRSRARVVSTNIDAAKIEAFIHEAEIMDLKPMLGDLFVDVVNNKERFQVFVEGGVLILGDNRRVEIEGLKTALAYFAFARMARNGDAVLTRYGFVNKENSNSYRAEMEQREQVYNDCMAIGKKCVNECMKYMRRDKKHDCKKFKIVGE